MVKWLFLLLGTFSAAIYAGPIVCTQDRQIQAEEFAGASHDWDSLHTFYKQFVACDDGGTAEGVSETVMNLLSQEWQTTSRLIQLVSKDRGFKKFVLNHIDATGNLSDIVRLKSNARKQCPKEGGDFCRLIIDRAKTATGEMSNELSK